MTLAIADLVDPSAIKRKDLCARTLAVVSRTPVTTFASKTVMVCESFEQSGFTPTVLTNK
jgi:hypothetical protein